MNTQILLRPSGNFYRTDKGYMLELELPGVSREGLELELGKGRLIVRARRTLPQNSGREVFRETVPGMFHREFRLDPAIDGDRITADLRDGVLSVALPKRETAQLRRIEVG